MDQEYPYSDSDTPVYSVFSYSGLPGGPSVDTTQKDLEDSSGLDAILVYNAV